MLCKRCKTAVSETELRCRYCGARVRSRRRSRRMAGGALTCFVALACGAYIYMSSTGLLPFGDKEPGDAAGTHETAPSESPPPYETELPATPAPSATADLHKSLDEVWPMLENAYDAVCRYMDTFAPGTPYVTQNGYLFDWDADAYVTARDLAGAALLDEEYAGEKILLLYFRPSDAADFTEAALGHGSALTVFAAYETKDGIAVLGAGNVRGVIYRENMNALLAKYASAHGLTQRLASDSEAFRGILEAINAAEPVLAPDGVNIAAQGYDVRHLVADERYGFAVVSAKPTSNVLQGYFAALSEDEEWQVVPYEESAALVIAVNNAAPDVNLRILPAYDIAAAELRAPDTFFFILDYLLEYERITENDMPVTFISGNDEMLYMELQSGLNFFGKCNSANEWELVQVQSWIEAEALMRTLSKTPPLYIIRQE